MNKIYKVIWSKVKHQYVVVSELAHSCTKSTSSRVGRSAAAVLAALVLTTGVCAVPVQAADPTLEELYYEQMNRAIQNGETSSPLVTLAEVPATTSAATEDGEPAAEEETQPGEDGSVTGTASQYTVTNKDGFYASNTKGTHNTLSKDGLWVGGKDDNTGFHVDNDGNVRTTGSVTVKSEQGDVIIQNGGVQAGNVKINTDGKNTITGLTNTTWDGTTETPDRAATEGQLGQVQGDLNELNKAAVKYDSDGQGGYTNNVTIGGQVTANSFQNTDGSFSVDANGNVDAETVKSEGMSVVDEDGNTTFQVLANGDVTAHDVTATTVTGGTVIGETIRNTNNSFSVDANGNVDAETVKSEGMSVVDEDGNTTFQVLSNGDVTATTVTGGTVIGETIRNTNNSFSVDANGNVDAETVKSEGMSVVDEDGNTTFQVLSNGDVTAHAVTATTVTGGTIQNADGSFSVDANGNVDAETVKSEGMSVVDEDGNTTFQVLANGDVTAHDVIANSYSNVNGTFVADENGKVTAEKGDIGDVWLSEGNISNVKKITAESGNIGDVKLADGKVTADKGDIGDVWLSEGNISNVKNINAESGNIGDVKLADGKVTAEKGDIGDVWLSEGNISNVKNIKAESGNIGDVKLADGKVTADKGDIGDVWLSEGNISNVKKITAESGNIGDVKLADGKVTAEKGDIGDVWLSEGNISNVKNIKAESGNIGDVKLADGKVTAKKGDIGDVWLSEGNISNVKKITAKSGNIGDVKLADGKVTAEKGDIGDVWLSDGNISNVQNITAERGTIGDVKLVDGKVTAEKGDIGDVWLSEGNISNVQNIKAESGNIGDVKLADGKVTAQKADIGGVFIKNESIQAGNIKINENGSNEITGLSNTRWNDGTPVDEDRAATEGQLSTVQGYVDDLEKKTQHITHTATDNGHYTTIEDHTNFNSDGSIDAVDGQFRVTSDGGLMLKDEAGNETFRIYNGTGGMKAASGKFVVNGETGEVTVDESLSVGKHDDGTYAFTVDKAGNAEVDGTMVIQGQTIINADADIKGSLEAAGNKFKVDGITGEVTAPKGNIGGVILETTDDGKSKVSADKADIGGVIIKDKGIEAGTVQINKGSATDNRVIDVNGNFAVYNDGAFKAAGENFVVKATGDVTANSYTAGNVQINTDGHNTITGLSNVEWSGNAGDIVADRAATEGQLMTVQNDVQHISHETVDGMHYTKVEDTQIWNDGRIVTTGTVEAADAEFYADSQELVTAGQLYAAGIIPGEAKATPDKVNSQDSIAIGKGSNADIKATAIGSATSANQYSVVVGHQATADGIESVAVGRGASASNKGTVALGMYAKAEAKNAVALGTNSVADRADTVSVGSKDNERQITNVKAGKEDTDAVNVAQLKGVQDKVGDADFSDTNYAKTADNVTDAVKYVDAQVKVNSDDLAAYKAAGIVAGNEVGQYSNSIALGTDATVVNGTNSIAVGAGSTADGAQATALGQNSNALGDGAVSLGANSEAVGDGAVSIGSNNSAEVAGSVAIGNGAHVYEDGTNSVALGQWSQASDDRVVSVGNDWLKRRITNVAAGTDPTDAVNVQQLTARTANMVEWDEGTDDTIHGVTLENGMITAADGKFKVYGTGGIYAAKGKFQVNGNTGDVSAEGNLQAADGKFFVNGDNGSIIAADGDFKVSGKGDVTAAGSLTAADEKFKVYGASGGFMAANGKVEVNGYTGDIRTDGKVTANEIHAANDNFIVYESGVVKLNDGNLVIGTNGDLNSKGTITGNVLSTGGFVANADGNAEAKGTVTANTLSTGADGFIANSDGDFEARNAYIDGTLLVGEKFKVTPDGELIAANSAFKVGADGTVTAVKGGSIGGVELKDGEVTGLNNTTWDAGNIVDDRAATEGQLAAVDERVNANSDALAGYEVAGITSGTNTDGTNSIAIGEYSGNVGSYSVAVGVGAGTSDSYNVAIGAHAQVTGANSVALGYGSYADEDNVVSVGKYGDYRRIVNVADGVNEHDAVNVGQLDEVKSSVSTIDDDLEAYKAAGVVPGTAVPEEAEGAMALGTGAEVRGDSDKAMAIGNGAGAASENAVAVGASAQAIGSNSLALGPNARTELEAHNGVAIGSWAKATEDNAIAIGQSAGAKAENAVAVGMEARHNSDDSIAIGTSSNVAEGGIKGIALGAGATIKDNGGEAFENGIAVGTNATVSRNNAIAIGMSSNSDGQNSVALGSWASATGYNSVALGFGSKATANNVISVGDVGYERKIVNVAKGDDDYDAVNVAQLKSTVANATNDVVRWDPIANNRATDRTITGLTNTSWGTDPVVENRAATEGQLAAVQKQVTDNTTNIADLSNRFEAAGITDGLEKMAAVANQLDGANLSALKNLSQIAAPMSLNAPTTMNALPPENTQEATGNLRDPNSEWGNNTTTEDMTTINNNLTVTGDTHLKGDLEVDGEATFNDNVSIKGDLNMNNNKITGVADGTDAHDAVNFGQLDKVQQQVDANTQNISTLGGAVNKLGNRIDEVGAGAAALAALHPLDFDPDNKWDFSAGYGNYRGESAVAFGAFYRPNEDTMFSVGGTVGNDDNMVNAGVSLKIGSGSSGVTTSRVAMAKEIKAMRDVVAKQDAQIQKLTAMVNALVGVQSEPDTTTMFPDVPENHWAYEAVAAMARSGLVKGYPDGEFKGDRTMTRYEFAQIIQNAIQAGAEVDSRLVEEFKPELEYFHIATVAKDKDGNPTIERVRAN